MTKVFTKLTEFNLIRIVIIYCNQKNNPIILIRMNNIYFHHNYFLFFKIF